MTGLRHADNTIVQGRAEQKTVLWRFCVILVHCSGAPDLCLNICIVQKAVGWSCDKLERNFWCVSMRVPMCVCEHVCVKKELGMKPGAAWKIDELFEQRDEPVSNVPQISMLPRHKF